MVTISMDVPTYQISDNELENLPSYLYQYEEVLKEYGAIKIQLNNDCKLALKKRPKDLPTHEINKEIVKMNSNNLIYLVENCNEINQCDNYSLLTQSENQFWSRLASLNKRQLGISFLPNKSFFSEKTARIYFDIHRIPRQSILQISGKKVINQLVPCIKRAHRRDAIFPLSSIYQHLFSVDYHHEGGNHHWYVVPNSQRERLQNIINRENSSICLDHQQIFLHPSFFEKNHIRYHKIIQSRNEFVILSSGALFQSYTEDASWSESIDFALPSWITQHYEHKSSSLCKCHSSSSILIYRNLFPNDLVQKYIQSLSKSINDNKSNLSTVDNQIGISTTSASTSSIKTNSLNDAMERSTNVKVPLSRQEIFSSSQSSLPSSINRPLNDYTSKNNRDNNVQSPCQSSDESNFECFFGEKTFDVIMVDSMLNKHLAELRKDSKTSFQMTPMSSSIKQDFINNCDEYNQFLSYEELMDTLPSIINSVESQTNETNQHQTMNNLPSDLFNSCSTTINRNNHLRRQNIVSRSIDDYKTLFVSGLKHSVNIKDIYKHFNGYVKVTLKQHHTTSNLKYAFVLHRTSQDAESNLQRPIDFDLFGPKCRVEYARGKRQTPRLHGST
ncbi:hypothetical protein I4U23_016999 [Adineta vaga]|nr:hypothetical protein I4U23_016999 [Adineta vaga]